MNQSTVGALGPPIAPAARSGGFGLPPFFLLFAALGMSIMMLAATPPWALERTWILRPLADQRPQVAMAGVTVVVLTGLAYLLGHWSP